MLLRLLRPFLHVLGRWPLVVRQRLRWARDEVEVAPGSFVARGAVLGHRVRINRPSFVDPCEIGPYTVTGAFVVRCANHHTEFLNLQEGVQRRVIGARSVLAPPTRGVRIGAACWIGDNVTILDGVQVGDGAVIGAGSVVTRSVPAYAVAVGNPARVVRSRYPDEVVDLLSSLDWWTWSDEQLRANADLFELDLTTVDPADLRRRIDRLG
ncbi:DapH/DapD/GlmU-related protein [Nocardioides panacisoli]|uniref:DapH/DapD/GlmU-related protein n=1 Tax=Nocardioides panacisoli TaxID=627624 RepID=UPI0023528CE2|nr:DapH/DapD/GlmU-related protein [Nocardioides panacisoli]